MKENLQTKLKFTSSEDNPGNDQIKGPAEANRKKQKERYSPLFGYTADANWC